MYSETFEIIFYNLDRRIDSIQQYSSEGQAREIMSLFDEPRSSEVYSEISLSKTTWMPVATTTILDRLVFWNRR